jgi:P-type Ca2+ transporter type 2C
MNARFDAGTAFNPQLFDNRKLWLALAAVLVLQVVVVNWGPAQAVFDTVALNLGDWTLAAGTAACVLLLDEARKLVALFWRRWQRSTLS